MIQIPVKFFMRLVYAFWLIKNNTVKPIAAISLR